jgi:hypothetical protein
MSGVVSFESFSGPGDPALGGSLVKGYQPASRVGEVVVNAFVDISEHGKLKSSSNDEFRPPIYAWASCSPGMVAVTRKQRTAVYRSFASAENACPVVVSSSCLEKTDDDSFFFAGIVRSASVFAPDNTVQNDNFFTLSIGGVVTVLNNSGSSLCAGDMVGWTFEPATAGTKRGMSSDAPRRIRLTGGSKEQSVSYSAPNCIGRCLSFSKNGEPVDILLKQ